jgi:hypothetical protein
LKNAPIAGIINGKLNSTIKLNGNLDATAMRPDLKSNRGFIGAVTFNNTKCNKFYFINGIRL